MSYDEIFDDSYERVVHKTVEGQEFFEAFYDRFLRSSEAVRQKFVDTEMVKQRKMLKKSFYSLLVFYGSNQADDYLVKIAEKHDRQHLNILPSMYDDWLEALIETVWRFDEKVDNEVELAWRLVLSSGITYMKFKYDH